MCASSKVMTKKCFCKMASSLTHPSLINIPTAKGLGIDQGLCQDMTNFLLFTEERLRWSDIGKNKQTVPFDSLTLRT